MASRDSQSGFQTVGGLPKLAAPCSLRYQVIGYRFESGSQRKSPAKLRSIRPTNDLAIVILIVLKAKRLTSPNLMTPKERG